MVTVGLVVNVATDYFCFSAHSPLIAIHRPRIITVCYLRWSLFLRAVCATSQGLLALRLVYINWFWKRKTTSKPNCGSSAMASTRHLGAFFRTQVGAIYFCGVGEVSRAGQVRSADMSELILCASTPRRAAVGVQSESARARLSHRPYRTHSQGLAGILVRIIWVELSWIIYFHTGKSTPGLA